MALKNTIPETMRAAQEALGLRDERPIGHNTKLVRTVVYDDFDAEPIAAIAVRYHSTNIIIFRADGQVQLFTGGWHTTTTISRLNYFLRAHGFHMGYSPRLDKSVIFQSGNPRPFDFEEGFNFEAYGRNMRIGA